VPSGFLTRISGTDYFLLIVSLLSSQWLLNYKKKENRKKFWEEVIAYFP
jgi:hypothetical protein